MTDHCCKVPDCNNPVLARGWCRAHYTRWLKYGDPTAGSRMRNSGIRFLEDVALTYQGDDCLIWPYYRDKGGYGIIWVDGRHVPTSRHVCELVNGPPSSPNYEAAHSCGNGHLGCVNPRHLSWKTPVENAADKLVHGTHNRGERCGLSKLTEADVIAIRAMKGKLLQREIAEIFGVCSQTISSIQSGKRWHWFEDNQNETPSLRASVGRRV